MCRGMCIEERASRGDVEELVAAIRVYGCDVALICTGWFGKAI